MCASVLSLELPVLAAGAWLATVEADDDIAPTPGEMKRPVLVFWRKRDKDGGWMSRIKVMSDAGRRTG